MAEQQRDEHGRFASSGSSAHAASKKAGHAHAAAKHRQAASAARKKAKGEKDPMRRAEHLGQASHHDALASRHEHSAKHGEGGHGKHGEGEKREGGEKKGLAKWIERAKEGIKERGEAANKLEKTALSEGGLSKAAVEAAGGVIERAALTSTGLGGAAAFARYGAKIPGGEEKHEGKE